MSQGWFVPISLRPVLKIVAAYVKATGWSLCSYLLPPGRGFNTYKTAHRIKFRVLSIALEKELETLDYGYHLPLIVQLEKNPPAMQETLFDSWVRKICWRRDRLPTPVFLGFPCGSAGKEYTCSARDLGSIPG